MRSTSWRYEITLAGPCPQTLQDLLGNRYLLDPVDLGRPGTLIINDIDQASLRAVLSLLWDSGLTVVSLSSGGSAPQSDPS